VPSFDALEPLAPDACRSDPSAPCAYWHTKLHALNGGRDKLSERELEFVGVDTWPINTPGWHQPTALIPRSPDGRSPGAVGGGVGRAALADGYRVPRLGLGWISQSGPWVDRAETLGEY